MEGVEQQTRENTQSTTANYLDSTAILALISVM